MGTTLTGTTPQDTYDSLIKVTDNGPLSGTLKLLSDGLGNDSALALSTSVTAIRGGQQLRLFRTDNAIYGSIQYLTGTGGFKFDDANGDGFTFAQGADTRLFINATGNVGIGTTAPPSKLSVFANNDTYGLQINTNVASAATTRLSIGSFGAAGAAGANGSIAVGAVHNHSGSAQSALTFYTHDGSNLNEVGRFLATGGLTFNGDSAAANALDDYEEGTWTIGVTFGGASVGVTTSNNTGTYTKIGRQVTVNGLLQLTSKGSSTGTALLTGLPFAIPASVSNYASASIWFNKVSFVGQFSSIGTVSTTRLELWDTSSLGVLTAFTNSNFANDSEVMISFTYFV